jgi:hypothetical protein
VDPSPPIFGFNAAREGLVREVVERIVESAQDPLFYLNDAAYNEIKRLEPSRKKKDQERLAEWQRLARSIGRMTQAERVEKLRELATDYGWDVAGNFDPRVYKLSTKVLPGLVTGLLAPRTLAHLARHPRELISLEALSDKVKVEGPLEKLQKVSKKGVMVFVPTHLSNMDSIVFGYALERRGCRPPPTAPGRTCSRTRCCPSSCTTSARTASIGACGTRSTRTCSRRTRACCSSTATTRCSSRAAPARAPAASSGGSSWGWWAARSRRTRAPCAPAPAPRLLRPLRPSTT